MSTFNKALIIGLDGASLDLIMPWVNEGKLPNIGAFLSEGACGKLNSVPNMNSAPAWSSMVTGKNPGKHGIFWFNESQTEDYQHEYINASFRDGKPVWKLLGEKGKKVAVVNVPISFPADKVNGCLLAGMDAPSAADPRFSYPEGLYMEVAAHNGGYRIVDEMTSFLKRGKFDAAIKSLYDTIRLRHQAARYLMQEKEWDFFMVVFTATDRVQHMFWKYMDTEGFDVDSEKRERYKNIIQEVYIRLDHIIKDLTVLAGDGVNTMIVSDHGGAKDNRRSRLLPLILEDMGLLVHRKEKPDFLKDLLVKTSLFMDRTLSRDIKKSIANRFPSLRKKVEKNLQYRNIDWNNTRAFSDGNRWEIWINLKNRQRHGIVNPGREYDNICGSIIKVLKECTDAESGKPLFKNIRRREDIYHGRYVDKAPDLLVEWEDIVPSAISCNGNILSIEGGKKGVSDPLDELRSGGHSRFGILLMKGPDIKKGIRIDGADILDITPTVLYAMGEPVPSDMDGKALTGFFNESFLQDNIIKEYSSKEDDEGITPQTYSDKEAEEIEKRLKGLGYIN